MDLHLPLSDRLAKSESYIAAQATADPQNKLGAEATELTAARDELLASIQERTALLAQLEAVRVDIVRANRKHDVAMRTYADAAARLVEGDAAALHALGVEAAAKPTKGAVAAPVLTIARGEDEGEAKLRCAAVRYAGAYEFEYKLEPSQPSDPWLHAMTTKHVEAILDGLPAAQRIRARARAIGATPGPWSNEVIGVAR